MVSITGNINTGSVQGIDMKQAILFLALNIILMVAAGLLWTKPFDYWYDILLAVVMICGIISIIIVLMSMKKPIERKTTAKLVAAFAFLILGTLAAGAGSFWAVLMGSPVPPGTSLNYGTGLSAPLTVVGIVFLFEAFIDHVGED